MITYKTLGYSGRLGNQMFQYAMLLGIKKKHGFEIMLNEDINNNKIELTNCFQLKECHFYNSKDINTGNKFEEERFHFDKRFFKKINDSTNFHGYFQSEKYFEHCINDVRSEFTFRVDIQKEAKDFLLPYKNQKLVSIHVRRGDYVNQPNYHPVCSVDYYKEAMAKFHDVQYIIMSDDIDWCKENLNVENAVYSDKSTSVDMCIMSMCDDNIIANSSFSWWGAWLNNNPDKKVIAPKIWFGPYYSHYDTTDLYCKEWIQL